MWGPVPTRGGQRLWGLRGRRGPVGGIEAELTPLGGVSSALFQRPAEKPGLLGGRAGFEGLPSQLRPHGEAALGPRGQRDSRWEGKAGQEGQPGASQDDSPRSAAVSSGDTRSGGASRPHR